MLLYQTRTRKSSCRTIFQHGTQRRSNNEWCLRDSCELVRNGRIGKVTHALVPVGPPPGHDWPDYSVKRKVPNVEEFDWDMWLGPPPWRSFSEIGITRRWQRYRRGFGLRAIGNWGSHTLDIAQWALDKDGEGPVEIIPASVKQPFLRFRYADGVEIRCPRTKGEAAVVLLKKRVATRLKEFHAHACLLCADMLPAESEGDAARTLRRLASEKGIIPPEVREPAR